jgi:uncharacterized protein involved in exopolysaccharide biosynthesis/Mrp family chromosome partitioning ATPase
MTMEDTEFDLRGLISLLRRQLRLIIIVTVLAAGIAALVVFSLTPKYSASAMLLVDTSQKNLLDPTALGVATEIDTARVDSEVEILLSPAVLMQVIGDMGLVRDPEFGVKLGLVDRAMAFLQISPPALPTGEAAVARVLGSLRAAVEAERLGRTNLLRATVMAATPERAAEIANAWADAYIRDQVTAKVNSSLKSRDVLEARLGQARDAIVTSEGAFDTYINDSLSQIVKESGRADIASMRDQLTALGSTRDADAQRVELAQASLKQRDWTALADTLQSEALRELDRQQRELTQRLALANAESSIDLKSELARVEQRLTDAAAGDLSSLRQSVTAAETQQSEVRQQLRSAVLGSSLSPETLSHLYELQQGSELARTQYQTLLSRIKEAEAQAAVQVADTRVVSAALPPARPAFPNVGLSIGLAALGGLGLGLGLAFIRENIAGGILTEEQAAAVLHVPVVAALPRDRATGSQGGVADVMISSPLSSFPEAVRRIKVQLDQAIHRRALKLDPADRSRGRVVMVTSSTANEGKSTVALSLARAFALSRRSVVIIDCDLRKPTLHRMLGLAPSTMLIDHLGASGTDAPNLEQLVAQDPSSELRVVIGSRPSDVPTDQLIASPAFAQLIESAKAAYSVVILDTPPVGPVVDGLYLAQIADFVLFVLRSGVTSQTEARMALQAIRDTCSAEAEILAVLNQQDRANATYKGKYESYYSSDAE